jgi:hypothetical protein
MFKLPAYITRAPLGGYITRAPLGGALYARKCFSFFSKDEAFVRHYIS